MVKNTYLLAAVLSCSILALSLSAETLPKHRDTRMHDYQQKTYGRSAITGHAASAALSHHPAAWGGGAAGFGRRFGSSMGTGVLNGTIALGIGALRHEDFHYYKSHKQGTWPRVKYAVASTFITRKTNRPGRTVAAGRLSGAMGSGLIAQAWQPAASIGGGLSTGGISIGAAVATNITREFLPERKHNRHGHAAASVRPPSSSRAS